MEDVKSPENFRQNKYYDIVNLKENKIKPLTDDKLKQKVLETMANYIADKRPMSEVLEMYYEEQFLSDPKKKAEAFLDDEKDQEAKQLLRLIAEAKQKEKIKEEKKIY
ncbi:MAG: hypothetical protein ABH808_03455 [Candidatus Kuenenbacteria bacterium]